LDDSTKNDNEELEEKAEKPKKKVIKLSDIDYSEEPDGTNEVNKIREEDSLNEEDLKWDPEAAVKKFKENADISPPPPSLDAGEYLNIKPRNNNVSKESFAAEDSPINDGNPDEEAFREEMKNYETRIPENDVPSHSSAPTPKPTPQKMTGARSVNIAAWLLLVLSAGLGIGLFLFLGENARLKEEVADFRSKAMANAEVAKKMVAEKQKIIQETAPLREESESIAKKLSYEQDVSAGLQKQNENLKTKIADSQKVLSGLQSEMQGYADEIKSFASEEIKYFQAYVQEKENTEKLNKSVEDLKSKMETLSGSFASIEDEYKKRETGYIYNMAFLYARSQMFDEAIQSFLQFLEMGGDDADVHYNLAIIYDQVKKDKYKAVKHYEKYLALNPQADDLYEITMRINSIKRTSSDPVSQNFKNFSVDLEGLKY